MYIRTISWPPYRSTDKDTIMTVLVSPKDIRNAEGIKKKKELFSSWWSDRIKEHKAELSRLKDIKLPTSQDKIAIAYWSAFLDGIDQ